MEPMPDDHTTRRARLRDKYNQVASHLVQTLRSQPQTVYPSDELANLGVSLATFDPDSQNFLNPKACLFDPLSSEALGEYSLVESELNGGAIDYYFNFDDIYYHPTNAKNPSTSYIQVERADQIRHYLNILYTHYEKECEGDIEFLDEVTGWDEIKHDNPFHRSPKGLLLGCGPLSWDSKSKREWQEDYDDQDQGR